MSKSYVQYINRISFNLANGVETKIVLTSVCNPRHEFALSVTWMDDVDDIGEDDDDDHNGCDLNFVCNSGQESALSLALPEQTNSKTNFDD